MTLLTPLALALLALIPPIIALYLLKLRRQDYEVSSVYLWQRFVRDVEANAPWQRLRRNLLLLLQILFLLLLIFTLARPATETEGLAGQNTVIIVDNSASMQATDIEGSFGQSLSRLEAAQNSAADLVANLPADARVTVIAAAGGEADLLVSASRDRRQALDAIAAVPPTVLDSDLSPALALAEAIIARETNAEIVLLSDGAVQLPDQPAPVRFMPLGQTDANQAITVLSVSPAGEDQATLFVQVSNFSQEAVQRRLIIEVDGTPLTVFDLDLPALGHVEQVVEGLPAEAEAVAARLAPTEADVLAVDDRAWAVLRAAEPAQATLVGEGNFFLQTALNLLGGQYGGLTLRTNLIAPDDWQADEDETGPSAASSFHIFDGFVPDTLPPGNLLLIAPPASVPGLFEVAGQMATPLPEVAVPDHPLLRSVDLADMQILATQVLSPETGLRTIVGGYPVEDRSNSQPVPLLLAGEIKGRRVAVLAFDLHQSDLPLHPTFPILIANLARYLAPGAGGLLPAEIQPDQAVALSLPAGTGGVNLTGPTGQTDFFQAEAGRVNLPALSQPGLYEISYQQTAGSSSTPAVTRFAVNFFNPTESAIAPQPDLAVVDRSIQTGAGVVSSAHREWWRPLALGALALLVIEWLVYQRSNVLRLWHTVAWPATGNRLPWDRRE